jgi:hypothetical protein
MRDNLAQRKEMKRIRSKREAPEDSVRLRIKRENAEEGVEAEEEAKGQEKR